MTPDTLVAIGAQIEYGGKDGALAQMSACWNLPHPLAPALAALRALVLAKKGDVSGALNAVRAADLFVSVLADDMKMVDRRHQLLIERTR